MPALISRFAQALWQPLRPGYAVAAGHGIFVVLMVLAAVHAWPRMLLVDGAYQVYHLWQDEQPFIVLGRWVTILYQWLPALCSLAGADLDTVVIVYSLSIVGIYWLCYAAMAHILHRPWHALALAVVLAVAWQNSFYFAIGEHLLALCLVAVLWAWYSVLQAEKMPWWHTALWAVAAVAVCSQHLLYGSLLLPLVLYEAVARSPNIRLLLLRILRALALTLPVLALAYLYIYFFGAILTEKSLLFRQNLQQSHLWFEWVYVVFEKQLHHEGIPYVLTATIFLLALSRQWLQAPLLLAVTWGYLLLVTIYNLQGEAPYYMHLYGLLPISLCLLLCVAAWGQHGPQRLVVGLCLLAAGVGLFRLHSLGDRYQARLDWMAEQVAQSPGHFTRLYPATLPYMLLQTDWAMPYESLLYTYHLGRPGVLLGTTDPRFQLPLPNKALPHISTANYMQVNTAQHRPCTTPPRHSLRVLNSNADVLRHNWLAIGIELRSTDALSSIPLGQKMHWEPPQEGALLLWVVCYDAKGNPVHAQHSPLSRDVIANQPLRQQLAWQAEPEPGMYTLAVLLHPAGQSFPPLARIPYAQQRPLCIWR